MRISNERLQVLTGLYTHGVATGATLDEKEIEKANLALDLRDERAKVAAVNSQLDQEIAELRYRIAQVKESA